MFLDLHSHMLPGLDDGASDWDQSLAMASAAAEDGIEGVVCTPHWVLGRYENTRPMILSALEKLREKMAEHDIPLKVYPGAELRLDVSLLQRIRAGDLLTINDTGRYALIELPEEFLPQGLEDFLWDLKVQKITPIISHPERNAALLCDPNRLYKWVQMGILTQLTSASLLGRFGTKVQEFAALLLEHKLVHVLVTDTHGTTVRTPKLSEGYRVIEDLEGKEVALQLVYEIPRRIIQGEPVSPEEPISIPTRTLGFTPWKRLFSFLFVSLAMIFCIFACTPAWGPPIKEIRVAKKSNHERYTWDNEGKLPAPAIQEIETKKISQLAEERLIQLQRQELSARNYIREKFKGKQVVFPEEVQKEPPERPSYRIGVEDELYILVWQNPELTMDVVVRDDGKISLPLVGEVEVAGLQVPRLEGLLQMKYAKYVENPQVTVTVKAVNSLKVFITGAVSMSTITAGPLPAGFPLRGDKRLLTALSQVEILSQADLSEAYIVRGEIIIPLDLDRLLKDGDMTQNILLKPADTIVIPARMKEIVVLGEVNQPGRHRVKRRTTVLDAIAVAGGIKRATAVLHMAYVARRGSVLPINFKMLINMGNLDQNILLEDNDVIYVPNSQENKVFVLGEVVSPGVIRFAEPIDILEAVSEAGDFKTTANRGQVVVVRGGPHESRVYAVNLLKMMKGDTFERFMLDRQDIVYVPRTLIADWNVFINQLLPTITVATGVNDLLTE